MTDYEPITPLPLMTAAQKDAELEKIYLKMVEAEEFDRVFELGRDNGYEDGYNDGLRNQ